MFLKTVQIVLYSLVVLASTKQCKPGQNCELRCCTTLGGDVLCRERCLGISCELDVHCDGDCCVNSTCSSCLLKRLSSTRSNPAESSTQSSPGDSLTTNLDTIDKPKVVSEEKTTNKEDRLNVTRSSSPTKRNSCSGLRNECHSNCCIDGQCVDRSQCLPVKAARGGRGGGRSGGRIRGGGGGASSGGSLPVWAIGLIVGLSVLFSCIIPAICWCVKNSD